MMNSSLVSFRTMLSVKPCLIKVTQMPLCEKDQDFSRIISDIRQHYVTCGSEI